MTHEYHAYTPVRREPVRTFNAPDLAESYAASMARMGCNITIKRVRKAR